ncbi:MAG: hydrogenase maturation protease [Candidatus Omnitrophica bacterium]|nr:hydrogenase maturation protease [Candidatus Omnitrophota bacterium]
MSNDILVLGIGNQFRSDDQIGLLAAKAIEAKKLPNVVVRLEQRDGLALLEIWKSFRLVIAIDAVCSNQKVIPGTIYYFEADQKPLPTQFRSCSTHAFGLAEAIELSRNLGMLPTSFTVYGVEGKNFEEGEEVSMEVKFGIDQVVERIVHQIGTWLPIPSGVHDA